MFKKINTTKVFFLQQILLHTTPKCQKNYQLANAFIKMGDKFGQKKSKAKPYFAANVSQPDVAVKSVIQEKRKRFVRRENVLNKVFMSHITDFMSDGNITDALVGKGIEISKVKISPDFTTLCVFWVAREGQNDAEIQELLDSYAYPIRDILSQLRVVGTVPKIAFIKDKFKGRLAELHNILNQADFGEDFTPMYPSLLKTDHMRLSDPETVQNMALDDIHEMPPMRNDVFRLNHSAIMSEIEKVVLKSKALHRRSSSPQATVGTPLILGDGESAKLTSLSESDSNTEPCLSYVEYMRSKKIAKAKMRREKLAELEDREMSERMLGRVVEENEEEDYLDEESEESSSDSIR